ncbi:aminotransferase [Polychytrium aggregatum]|uniref:aminotransferase n=1 Tax=Polychytrium aggregatum TaxID=110093 RepID=UPI0022FEF5F4|nr:aminotransferase [Polychytrium aggregatum]KAI9209123.1 aminotransferase [Polychytrium aggregatum]
MNVAPKAVVVTLDIGVADPIPVPCPSPAFRVSRCDASAKGFLLDNTRGVYTAARSVNTFSIMDLPAHIQRLTLAVQNTTFDYEASESSQNSPDSTLVLGQRTSIVHEAASESQQRICHALAEPALSKPRVRTIPVLELLRDPARSAEIILPVWKESMLQYYRMLTEHGQTALGDCKVTILITCDQHGTVRITAHCDRLVQPQTRDCQVCVLGLPRRSPSVKDSKWVIDRGHLEKAIQSGNTEALLVDPHGQIYEGLISNFCVIKRDPSGQAVLQTAPLSHVLSGTVLGMVIHVCSMLGVPVLFEFPKLSERASWLAAFLTSTTRGAFKISRIADPASNQVFDLPSECSILHRIQQELELEAVRRAHLVLQAAELAAEQ